MKWYLNSVSGDYLHKQQFFTKKLQEHNCDNLLIIAHQSSKGASRAVEIITEREPTIPEVAQIKVFDPVEYNQGDYKVIDFDALYIKGGLFEYWDQYIYNPCGPKLYEDIRQFLYKSGGCYIGSSLGVYILFKQFETNPEMGEGELPSYWYDHGIGIFPDILPETHFGPPQNTQFLKKRMLANLKNHPELKYGVHFSNDCLVAIDSADSTNWQVLSGNYHIRKYNTKL